MKPVEKYLLKCALYRCFAASILIAGLTACATAHTPIRPDPLERINRSMFEFNDTLDRWALQPVARAYNWTLPHKMRISISNFFSNLNDVPVTLNHLLQGQITWSAESLMRVAMNSVFGVGGLFDVAQAAGLPKRQTDFGLTLGRYGLPMGPYLVLPFLGPSTVRDAAGLVFDYATNPMSYANPAIFSNSLYGGRLVSTRAALLHVSDLLSEVALDKYLFVRNAYLQRRAYLNRARPYSPQYEKRAPSLEPADSPLDEQNMPAQDMIPPHVFPRIHLGW